MEKFGYFKPHDPQLPGIRYGNWGSCPYEYMWAACVEPVSGKRVLDIGTGLPSEHNWHEFVRDQLKPEFYLGIDLDSRLKNEEIDTPNHKVLWMDATELDLPDDSMDLIMSISTFEHVDDMYKFRQLMKEAHRVTKPGGKMVVTLDEFWDYRDHNCLPWNELEKARVRAGLRTHDRSYGICDFAEDIEEWWTPCGTVPVKQNADGSMLYSPVYNDCVSYGVFEAKK